jgi:hypothetical protein
MRLLGLEVGPHEVRVARGERSFGTLRLTALERRPLASPAAVPEVLAELARSRADVVLTALPAHAATHRFLTLPFRDRGRLGRTAPLELLGQLPLDPAGLAVACEPLGPAPGGTAVLAAALRQGELEAHLALLEGAGLAPARVDLAPLPAWNLLPASGEDQALVLADGTASALSLRRAGRLAALRALGTSAREPAAFAAEVRWSLAALGGTPATIVPEANGSRCTTAPRSILPMITPDRSVNATLGWSAANRPSTPAFCCASAPWTCGKCVTFSARRAATARRSTESTWARAAASRTRPRAASLW